MRSRRATPPAATAARVRLAQFSEEVIVPDASGSAPQRPARPRNVFGEPLTECCSKPLTGFYRTGSCDTGPEDFGVHTVCAHVDAEFLVFSKAAGNDLSTPVPAAGFSGLKPGDCWCLCAARWKEAFDAGKAPKVKLMGTHEATLEIVPLDLLKKYAIDLS